MVMRLAFAGVAGVMVAWQVRALCLEQPGMPQVRPGASAEWLTLVTGSTADQTMRIRADGFRAIRVRARRDPVQAAGQVVFELADICDVDVERRVFRMVRPATQVTARDRFEIAFPELRHSAGHRYRLRISHITANPTGSIELLVNPVDVFKRESLSVDGRQQPGVLVFETSARMGTLFGKVQAAIQSVSPPLGATWLLASALACYDLALMRLLYLMLRF
jgi:hypothetical protein